MIAFICLVVGIIVLGALLIWKLPDENEVKAPGPPGGGGM